MPCGGVPYGDSNLAFIANDWHTALLPLYLQARYPACSRLDMSGCYKPVMQARAALCLGSCLACACDNPKKQRSVSILLADTRRPHGIKKRRKRLWNCVLHASAPSALFILLITLFLCLRVWAAAMHCQAFVKEALRACAS